MKKLINLIILIASFYLATPLCAKTALIWCNALDTGAAGSLDNVECDDIRMDDTDRAIATGDCAMTITSTAIYFHEYDADGEDAENSPDIIVPDNRVVDCDSKGQWNLVGMGVSTNLSGLTGILGFNAGTPVDIDTAVELSDYGGLGDYVDIILDAAIDSEADFKAAVNLEADTDFHTPVYTTGQTTDADPYTVTKTANKDLEIIEITTHQAAVTLAMSETNAEDGDIVILICVSSDAFDMATIADQQHLAANALVAQTETITFVYSTDRWVEKCRATNSMTFSSLAVNGGLFTSDASRIIPQSITYDDDDDLNQTIWTDLTSSIILVTGDNDADHDSIDLQDGVSAGDMISFIAVEFVDADDNFTVDAETDSTCTGCPNAGIFVLNEVGDSVTLYWTGTFWNYRGSVDAE